MLEQFRGGRAARREIWNNYAFAEVLRHAREIIDGGHADRVHIRNVDGRLLARRPKTR